MVANIRRPNFELLLRLFDFSADGRERFREAQRAGIL
jgi:hypothetical protein